jgi:hypothetical protein
MSITMSRLGYSTGAAWRPTLSCASRSSRRASADAGTTSRQHPGAACTPSSRRLSTHRATIRGVTPWPISRAARPHVHNSPTVGSPDTLTTNLTVHARLTYRGACTVGHAEPVNNQNDHGNLACFGMIPQFPEEPR